MNEFDDRSKRDPLRDPYEEFGDDPLDEDLEDFFDADPDRPRAEDLREESARSLKFRDFVRVCPACKQPITEDMDSCPYCGDILFRYLTDGTFAPRKGPLVKIMAVMIALLVILAVLGLLISLLI